MFKKLMAIFLITFLLFVSGVSATWKYATNDPIYTSKSLPIGVNEFIYPLFTVTYMVGEEVYLEEYHIDPTIDYTVIGAPNGDANFKKWVNANGVAVTSIPKSNRNDYTLYATWFNKYTINFIDANGNLIHGEEFVEGASNISVEGQAIVDKWLANENQTENANHVYVSWSAYDLASATADIIVRPEYDYQGYMNMEAVYEQPDDGVVDYYKVVAVDSLPAEVVVPGAIGGVPVKIIHRITNEEGENDWDNYEKTVTKITIEENVERLEWNSLAWTPNLVEVNLPNSLVYMGKNVFSRNFGNDKKKITINFNGTMQEWKAVLSNSNQDWDGGLKEGTVVNCSDGYFKLEKKNFFSALNWEEYPN
ncbi:MAG: hypothetical protein IKB66_01970 [Clostridia bacterium]|nr:hypothetical protein [Clostridia bacterium]